MKIPANRVLLTFALVFALAALAADDDKRLTTANRMEIIRQISYEYATLQIPLPRLKKEKEAVEINSTGEINEDKLREQLAKKGVAIETGEIVQLTGLKIKKDHIMIEVNGGGPKGKKWYERITVSAGGGSSGGVVIDKGGQGKQAPTGAGWSPGSGSWIRLDFDRRIPDVTPDEVKLMLAPIFEFGRDSATLPWIETIPEEFQDAIREKRAMVGMDREMVRAAMGRPENKVREMHSDGQEYEDWIYGYPPFLTFVTFLGDEVVEVREFK
jgi:hypothetical protein